VKSKIIEHILSIIFILFIFIFLYFAFLEKGSSKYANKIQKIEQIDGIDIDNPLQAALLKETIRIFYQTNTDSLLIIYGLKQSEIESEYNVATSGLVQPGWNLFFMYVKFLIVFILVMTLTYYGVQTLGVLRFVLKKQNKPPFLVRAVLTLKRANSVKQFDLKRNLYLQSVSFTGAAILKSIGYFILFSPAYVIAYSFKTKFDTDSIIFMILLGIISNGLLITYAQKFYTFLLTESRKGYVETAIVKNLNNDFSFKSIPLLSILAIRKKFPNHVFSHIYMNVRHQYLTTIKEQAAFLISGLIIIEMALNIHNHLSYELLQNLLYENYSVVLVILFIIYLTVKATEIFVDFVMFRENKKYANK